MERLNQKKWLVVLIVAASREVHHHLFPDLGRIMGSVPIFQIRSACRAVETEDNARHQGAED
jgi:hypothetical protein